MIKDLKQFPTFLASVFVGLVRAAITEIEVLLIALLGIAVGFAFSAWLGIIVFLAVYVTFRMVSQVAGLFSSKLDLLIRTKNGSL
jgi:hypothetical protein